MLYHNKFIILYSKQIKKHMNYTPNEKKVYNIPSMFKLY